jgi:aspartate kinase
VSGVRLVLRFGGTSLSSPLRVRGAADRIRFHVNDAAWVVAVVSAPAQESFRIARWLDRVSGERNAGAARELDRAAAAAEQVSAALLAAALAATGSPAISLRADEAGLIGDGGFSAGTLTAVDPGRLNALAEAGTVPVVTGGQVCRADGEVVMLRSRSADVIAVALAEALGAQCHFIADREGLDPAMRDGQLVHPAAAKRAEERNVPLKAYSFRSAFESVQPKNLS